MARIGRNDPCPCGSGKKHKHCCYEKFRARKPEELFGGDADWLKIRRTEGELVGQILDFATQRYGNAAMEEAFGEFTNWGKIAVGHEDIDNFFIPWFIFNWLAGDQEKELAGLAECKTSLALEYLQKNGRRLDAYQQAFIIAASTQPFSFLEITEAVPGKSLGLRDLFLDQTYKVKEAGGSTVLKRGDVIFGRVVSLEEQAIVVGTASVVIPPRYHLDILDFRDLFRKRASDLGRELNTETIALADLPLRRLYFATAEMITNPPRPELQNTDGDPIAFVTLYFDLHCSPAEALEGLRSLTLREFRKDILEDSVHDAEGNLVEFSFDWQKRGNKLQKHWDNTILGRLSVKGKRLTAEVNSEKRAKKIQSEIAKRLGAKATYKRSVNEPVEKKLEELKKRTSNEDLERQREEFQSSPEVQALLERDMKAHWEAWYTEPIPALANRTPMEAARTPEGRERLEVLLSDYERQNELVPHSALRADLATIRKRLGL
jgi:hypothetical protein